MKCTQQPHIDVYQIENGSYVIKTDGQVTIIRFGA